MSRVLRLIARAKVFFALLWILLPLGAIAGGLERMEQIAQKARDLKEFLSRPELVNEYYEAALEYYGPDKFPRNAFDAVLNQLRELDARVPALAQRLWETTNLGQGFEIQAAAKTSGLELKVSNWERHLEKWSGGLEKEAKAVLAISDPKRRAEYVKGVLEEASSSLSTFEAEVSSLPRVERIQRSKEFFLAFASGHPQFRAAGAYLVLEKIRSTEIDDLLRSKDADLVLDTIEKLRSSALEVPGGELCPKNLRSLILREHLPELSVPRLELINGQPAETELFRTLTRTGNRGTKVVLGRGGKAVYRFKPLPRRFHGIWKGIPLGECVGGSCNSLDALTPERWATIALKDSQIHNIERGDSYLGFVQYVPVRKGKKIYASVDLGAPILKNKVFVEEAASHRIEGKPMFDLWFKESLARKPGDWKGFVIGKSGAINNAGVLETARTSLPHDFGQIVGDSKEFTHLDPLAKQIVAASPTSHSFQRTYGGRMVTDGTVPDAAALTKLQRLSDDALNDPETVAKIIAGPNAKIRDKVLVFLKEHPPTDPRMQIMLARALANSHAEIADTCALILLKDRTGSEELIRHLDSLLTQQDKVIQLRAAAVLLARRSDQRAINLLNAAFTSGDPVLVNEAALFANSLGRMPNSEILSELRRLLSTSGATGLDHLAILYAKLISRGTENTQLQVGLAYALIHESAGDDPYPEFRSRVMTSIEWITPVRENPEFYRVLAVGLGDPALDLRVKRKILHVLKESGSYGGEPLLLEELLKFAKSVPVSADWRKEVPIALYTVLKPHLYDLPHLKSPAAAAITSVEDEEAYQTALRQVEEGLRAAGIIAQPCSVTSRLQSIANGLR